jgi:uncharacterized protein (TIGR00255 family)
MIKSMTAYATASRQTGDHVVEIEMRSYNSRNLDIVVRMPQRINSLEEKVKRCITDSITRGRVEVRIRMEDRSPEGNAYQVDLDRACAYYDALQTLGRHLSLEAELSLDTLAAAGPFIRPQDTPPDETACWKAVEACLGEALAALDAMRSREGTCLQQDFEKRLAFIEQAIGTIAASAEDLPAMYRDRLQERIGSLTRGLVEVDPARIAQEAAFLADRSDISEELVRAESHAKQFRHIMAAGKPAGRKLNFLLQEFNREFNTMGSKAGNASVSHLIVEVKSELEKLREQVQNVE